MMSHRLRKGGLAQEPWDIFPEPLRNPGNAPTHLYNILTRFFSSNPPNLRCAKLLQNTLEASCPFTLYPHNWHQSRSWLWPARSWKGTSERATTHCNLPKDTPAGKLSSLNHLCRVFWQLLPSQLLAVCPPPSLTVSPAGQVSFLMHVLPHYSTPPLQGCLPSNHSFCPALLFFCYFFSHQEKTSSLL